MLKLTKDPIKTVKIRQDRALALKEKALEITLATGVQVREADLVNLLIDTKLEDIRIAEDSLVVE